VNSSSARFAALCLVALTPVCVPAGAANPPEWSRPFPAHRIAGNVYYVGTEDLGCYLITDPDAGHILINSALDDTNGLIRAGIEKLGFQVKDIRILLTNQAHFDHAAGLAELQRWSGAKVFATVADAKLLETGGKADPSGFSRYAPVRVDRTLKDREVIRLGRNALTVHLTPGHSPGSVSYEMKVDGQTLLFANLNSVVMPLVNPKYPRIVADFRASFARQKSLKPDLWVASHGSQFGLADKFKAGSYADAAGYEAAVREYEKKFETAVKVQGADRQ
jgi:metallo-beta-lactamase class B